MCIKDCQTVNISDSRGNFTKRLYLFLVHDPLLKDRLTFSFESSEQKENKLLKIFDL